ncbi:MAG: dehydrogenase [Frankiales bacterium]|nr:dehydrogenase [Frankiales bacterium]
MKATVLRAPGDIVVEDVPDPRIELPTDAVVRVTAACICGSDLWPYRGVAERPGPVRIGHEFVGVVEEVGNDVRGLSVGSFVIAPFTISDGTCPLCVRGVHTSCLSRGNWGTPGATGTSDAGQGEAVRVPLAAGTLVPVPEAPDPAQLPDLLTLSDVMGTGHHAALVAGVRPGSSVVVVGDGAVGLCAVLAARRLGAEQVVVMSRHASRQAIARTFGASEVVEERGEEGIARIKDLFGGIGPDAVLECVGTKESMQQAVGSVRPGGMIGYVGAPYGAELPIRQLFGDNIGVRGGVAPVRSYIPELLTEVLSGDLRPGAVFDSTLPLEDVAQGYAAMDAREAVKVLLVPGGAA